MKSFDEISKLFEMDKEANKSSLKEYEIAKRYYHGEQLPSDVKALILERNQIPIVENIYKIIVDKILGYKSESIQEVKLSGRQVEDKTLATLLNDLLKVFSQQEEFDSEIIKRDKELILGLAVVQIWIKQDDDGDFHLSIENVPASSFVIDKYSTQKNAKDARRFHRILNTSASEAKAMFGKEIITNNSDFYDDRITLIESWIQELETDENGKAINCFNRYIWNSDNQILAFEKCPFKTHSHPFVVCKYQIDEKLKWYGLFRNIKSLQDYINLAENRMLNMMSSMKIFYEEGAVFDADDFVNSASADNAIVKVQQGALESKKIHFVQHQAQLSALSNKVQEKLNLAKILSGLNDEALGTAINRQSGIAIAQRRDAGLMGLGEYLKSSDEMDKAIFKKALSFIMHYFTKKQVFKIVDKEVGERYFTINDENDENSKIRVGKFDLIYKTQLKMSGREERFSHWSEMLKSIGQIRPDLMTALLPLMLKDTDSPIVEDIELVLQKADEAQQEAAQNDEIGRLSQELEIMKLKAQINELQSKALKYEAQAGVAKSLKEQNEQILNTEQNKSVKTARVKGIDLR